MCQLYGWLWDMQRAYGESTPIPVGLAFMKKFADKASVVLLCLISPPGGEEGISKYIAASLHCTKFHWPEEAPIQDL